MLGSIAVVAPMEPVWPLAVVAAALLVIVVIEGSGPADEVVASHDEGRPEIAQP